MQIITIYRGTYMMMFQAEGAVFNILIDGETRMVTYEKDDLAFTLDFVRGDGFDATLPGEDELEDLVNLAFQQGAAALEEQESNVIVHETLQ